MSPMHFFLKIFFLLLHSLLYKGVGRKFSVGGRATKKKTEN